MVTLVPSWFSDITILTPTGTRSCCQYC